MLFLLEIAAAAAVEDINSRTEPKKESGAALGHLYHHMRQRRLLSIAVVFGFFAFLAQGHAILLMATPAIGEVIRKPDIAVNLRFNSMVDAKRSRITLVHSGGGPRKLKLSGQSSPNSLNAHIHGLEGGSYTLQWQVLAMDGHISRGEVPFRVQIRPE
jgi:methionine-rich copper-binding protein CopC